MQLKCTSKDSHHISEKVKRIGTVTRNFMDTRSA